MSKLRNVTLFTLAFFLVMPFAYAGEPDFTLTITGFSADGSSTDLTLGMAPGATNGYDDGLDQYAPPAPPSGFDVALSDGADRYFTQILAQSNDMQTLYIELMELAGGSWDIAAVAAMGQVYVSDAFVPGPEGMLVGCAMGGGTSDANCLEMSNPYVVGLMNDPSALAQLNQLGTLELSIFAIDTEDLADLEVTSLDVTDGTATAVVTNIGAGAAESQWGDGGTVEWYVDGDYAGYEYPAPFAPGTSQTFTFDVSGSGEGDHTVTFMANTGSEFDESDYTNNTASADFYIEPLGCQDIEVSISLHDGSYHSEISWDITDGGSNVVASGGAPFEGTACLVAGDYTANGYDSYGDGWNGTFMTIINPDGVVILDWTLSGGTSGSEDFNTTDEYQPAFPDFVVDGMSFDGATGTFSTTISNIGDADLPAGTYFQGLEVAGGSYYFYDDDVAFPAGGSYTYNLDLSGLLVLPGDYDVMVTADLWDYVIESDEDNNSLSSTITVPVSADAPQNLTAEAGDGDVSLAWDAVEASRFAAGQYSVKIDLPKASPNGPDIEKRREEPVSNEEIVVEVEQPNKPFMKMASTRSEQGDGEFTDGPDFTFAITGFGDDGSSTTLTLGMTAGATNGYDDGIDGYAPPAPPSGFDVALSDGADRYFTQILAPSTDMQTLYIELQELAGGSWDLASAAASGQIYVSDSFVPGPEGMLVGCAMGGGTSDANCLEMSNPYVIGLMNDPAALEQLNQLGTLELSIFAANPEHLADLEVTSLDVADGTATAVVTNIGEGAAESQWGDGGTVEWYVDGDYAGYEYPAPFDPGTSQTFTFDVSGAAEGDHTVDFYANTASEFEESDYSNNSGSASWTVEPVGCSDLEVSITLSGGSYHSEISWDMADSGGNSVASGGAPYDDVACIASGTYTVNAADSYGDGWNGTMMTVTHPDGTVLLSWTLASGSAGSTTFDTDAPAPGPADLTVSSASWDGDTGTLSYSVTNIGESDAGSHWVSVWINNENYEIHCGSPYGDIEHSVSGLAAGESYSFDEDLSALPPGDYGIYVSVDNDCFVEEENEDNNVSDRIDFTIEAPTVVLYNVNSTDGSYSASDLLETSHTASGLTNGQEYCFYVTSNQSPAPSNVACATPVAAGAHFTVTETHDYMLIILSSASLQNASLADGDEIAVFDGGLAVGMVEYDSGNPPVQLLAWEDDAFTPETDGFADGNSMSFKAFQKSSQQEFDLTVDYVSFNGWSTDGTFSTDEIAGVDLSTDPRVSDIPDQTIDEDEQQFADINLDDYVTDPDDADSDISWEATGQSTITVSISGGVATLTYPEHWNGSESITFTATDPNGASDSDGATFTVNAVDDAPEVSDIGDQTIDEGGTFATFDLDDYLTEHDGDAVTWSVSEVGAPDPAQECADSGGFYCGEGNSYGWITDDCVPDYWICDGYGDCLDDSDEADCAPIGCDEGQWECDNGDCISASYYCDGSAENGNAGWGPDCSDGSDEVMDTCCDEGLYDDATCNPPEPGNCVLTMNDAYGDGWNGNEWCSGGQCAGLLSGSTGTADFSFDMTAANDYTCGGGSWGSEVSWSLDCDGATVASGGAPDAGCFGDGCAREESQYASSSHSFTDYINYLLRLNPGMSKNEAWVQAQEDVIAHGTDVSRGDLSVSIDADNVVTVSIPDENWFGSETYEFTGTDDTGNQYSASDAATFTVNAVNDAPVIGAIDDQATDEDTSIDVALSASDVDGGTGAGDENSLSFSASSDNADISASVDGSTLTLSASQDYHGSGTITVTVTDDGGLSDATSFTMTFDPVNDDPIIDGISAQETDEDTPLTITVSGSDVDDGEHNPGDENDLSFSASSDNADVSASIDGDQLTMSSTENYHGSATITVTITDDGGLSDATSFTLTINPVNDAPIANDDAYDGDEDTSFGGNVLDNDTDVDSETDGDVLVVAYLTSSPANGSLDIYSDGSFTYTPNDDYYGPDGFSYVADDQVYAAGSSCADGAGFVDCAGQCVDTYYLGWQGDGYCDDGDYGLYLYCEAFNWDDGDCDGAAPPEGEDKENADLIGSSREESNEASVSLTVNPVDDAPAFLDTDPGTDATVGVTYSYTASTLEQDDDLMDFYATIPGFLSVSVINGGESDGIFDIETIEYSVSGAPEESDVGDHDIWLTFYDGTSSADLTYTLTVRLSFDYDLAAGWDWRSFPVTALDSEDGEAFFADVLDSLSVVLAYPSGELYETPDGYMNTIDAIDPHDGYMIKMKNDETLTKDGARVPSDDSMDIGANWNWIGFYGSAADQTAGDAFSDLTDSGNLIIAKSRTGALLETPDGWVDGIGTLTYTSAYILKLNDAAAGFAWESSDAGEPGPGDSCADGAGFLDCTMQCVDTYYLGWQGDGYCDDGAYGLYLYCEAFNWDDGDCDGRSTADVGGKEVFADGVINVQSVENADYYQFTATQQSEIIVLNVEGSGLEEGAELAAYSNDICVGAVVYSLTPTGYFQLVVWEDDPYTSTVDGFIAGETITLKLWTGEHEIELTDIEWTEFNEWNTTGTFASNGIAGTVIELDGLGLAELGMPTEMALYANYPNPFNPETSIRYDLTADANVSLMIYDVLGRQVRTLVNGHRSGGYHNAVWDGRDNSYNAVPSGVYIYRLMVDNKVVDTRKMVMVK